MLLLEATGYKTEIPHLVWDTFPMSDWLGGGIQETLKQHSLLALLFVGHQNLKERPLLLKKPCTLAPELGEIKFVLSMKFPSCWDFHVLEGALWANMVGVWQ